MNIRSARLQDKQRLYEICLLTGDSGRDATGLLEDLDLFGDLWVGPYLEYSIEFSNVLEDDDGLVLGYCLGVKETFEYEKLVNQFWWPRLRKKYPVPDVSRRASWTRDEKNAYLLHNIPKVSPEIIKQFPSHGHINLVNSVQGKGWGRLLLKTVEEKLNMGGSSGIHLILNSTNLNALAFYKVMGYETIFENGTDIGVAKSF